MITFNFNRQLVLQSFAKTEELKDSYFKQAKINLSLVEKRFIENAKQVNLFESDNSEM